MVLDDDLDRDGYRTLYVLERMLSERPFWGIWLRVFRSAWPLIREDGDDVLLAHNAHIVIHQMLKPDDPSLFFPLKKSERWRMLRPAVRAGWLASDLTPRIPWAWKMYPCACIVADDGHLVAVSRCEGHRDKALCDLHLINELAAQLALTVERAAWRLVRESEHEWDFTLAQARAIAEVVSAVLNETAPPMNVKQAS
jgi:hypothetical protein